MPEAKDPSRFHSIPLKKLTRRVQSQRHGKRPKNRPQKKRTLLLNGALLAINLGYQLGSFEASEENKLHQKSLSKLNEADIPIDMIQKILEYILTQNLMGGVLIFLPGWEAITSCLSLFRKVPVLQQNCYFLPMHSQVPKQEH